jgi:hypothetical protein
VQNKTRWKIKEIVRRKFTSGTSLNSDLRQGAQVMCTKSYLFRTGVLSKNDKTALIYRCESFIFGDIKKESHCLVCFSFHGTFFNIAGSSEKLIQTQKSALSVE